MQKDDLSGDGKTQAEVLLVTPGRICPVKPLKYRGFQTVRDPGAIVGHRKEHVSVLKGNGQPDLSLSGT